MKWKNKGHEFDEIGQRFKSIEKIYIYGAGENGTELYKALKNANVKISFIDVDYKKQREGYLGCEVISPEDFFRRGKCDDERCLSIVSLGINSQTAVMKKFVFCGFKEGIDVYSYHSFYEFYLPIFLMYHSQKLYVKYLDVSLTQYCNLKCKECSIMSPYVKKPKHRGFESVCKDIDMFFAKVDYVQRFYLIGGEPLLYPYLEEVCDYVGSKYRNSIAHIIVYSNGLVPLKENLIQIMKKYNIEFQISDYSKYLEKTEEKLSKFTSKLDENKIIYNRMIDLQWVDYGFRHPVTRTRTAECMESFFDNCGIDCRGLENGKFYYCFVAKMNEKVLGYEEQEGEYFDLSEDKESTKMELLEFNLGYNDKGYINICERCKGSYLNNRNYIPVAEQL
ncbi:MAG: radical SAM protein [Lachnospiraceae bacterium]|nr:radical SAM protein [Lachnospiraceae bacterium]